MNSPPCAPMLLSEQRPAGPALAWMALLVGLGSTAFLSTPWPPGWFDALLAVAVWLACGAAIWTGGREQGVLVDPAGRCVERRTAFLGLGVKQRWALDEFDSVVVERRHLPVTRGGEASSGFDTHAVYVISLKGPGQSVEIQRGTSLADSERRASELARQLDLPPRREGYAAATEGPGAASQPSGPLPGAWRRAPRSGGPQRGGGAAPSRS